MNDLHINVSRFPELNPSLKLSWAKKHLDALDVEVGRFLRGETHSVRSEDDLESGEYILYLDPTPVDVTLGLIAGDAISCMRASLDHLACALTHTRGGQINTNASFPVLPFDNAKGRKLFKDSVIGIPKDAKEIIALFQPYHHGNANKATKLWKLHRLWNIDKHRRIPIYGVLAQIPVTFPTDMPPVSGGAASPGVMRFPLAAKAHVKLDPAVKVNIQFGDETEDIIVPAHELVDIYKFVRYEVFPQFKQFFRDREMAG